MVKQAERFAAFLQKENIQGFVVQELDDAAQSVLFRSTLMLEGRQLPIAVIFDNSIFTIIRVNLAVNAVNEQNDYELVHLMMRLNSRNKALKYYMAADTSLVLDCSIPALPGQFSPKLIQTLLQLVVDEVKKHYREFLVYL